MENLINKRYNYLVITGTRKNGNKTQLEYKCDCGKTGYTYKYLLESGQTKSCGCYSRNLRVEASRGRTDNRKAKGEAGKNRLFIQMKNAAKQRNVHFELEKEDVISLCSSNCSYCGAEPDKKAVHNKTGTYTNSGRDHAQFLYNGLDRVDNSIGYTLSNVVPCCTTCNKMKHVNSREDWIAQMKKILAHLSE